MADDEMRDNDAADDLDPAFDSIDATMKDVTRKAVTVTPDTLAQIVNDAVAKAITEYEQARGLMPEPVGDSPGAVAAPKPARDISPRDLRNRAAGPSSPWRDKIEQLKGDMGLDEIVFDGPPPEPVEVVVQRELSTQMGVNDFEFDDAPAVAGEPAPTRTETDAIAGWATPVHYPAPPATPNVEEPRAPAVTEQNADDADQDFKWITAALEAGGVSPEAGPPPAPPVVEAVPVRAPEAPAPVIHEPAVTHRPEVRKTLSTVEAQKTLGPPEASAPPSKPEVRADRRSLASWFRSALADQPPAHVPEPAAAATVPEPIAPAIPVASTAESNPRPAPEQNATAKPATSEDAANATVFTFDPIPPVPPPLPREPNKEPVKKTNKFGTFL